jgi:hypothetical protein
MRMKGNGKSVGGLRWRDLPGIVLVIAFLSLSLVTLVSYRTARAEFSASSRLPEIPFSRRGAFSPLVTPIVETTFGGPVR